MVDVSMIIFLILHQLFNPIMLSLGMNLVMAMLSLPPNATPGIINMGGAGRFEATLLANFLVGLLPLRGSMPFLVDFELKTFLGGDLNFFNWGL